MESPREKSDMEPTVSKTMMSSKGMTSGALSSFSPFGSWYQDESEEKRAGSNTFEISASTLGSGKKGVESPQKDLVEIVILPGALARAEVGMDSPEVGRLTTGTVVEVLERHALADGRTRLRVPFGAGSGWISDFTPKGDAIVRSVDGNEEDRESSPDLPGAGAEPLEPGVNSSRDSPHDAPVEERGGSDGRPSTVGSAVDVLMGALVEDERKRRGEKREERQQASPKTEVQLSPREEDKAEDKAALEALEAKRGALNALYSELSDVA
jgi:hypothetical protein